MQEILQKHGDSTFTVAVYLLTSPLSHMSGLYYCPLYEIQRHTRKSHAKIARALSHLESAGFCEYDHDLQFVWVVNMAFYQYQASDLSKRKDNRVSDLSSSKDRRLRGLISHLKALPDTCLVRQFRDFYNLPVERSAWRREGASEGASFDTFRNFLYRCIKVYKCIRR